MFKTAQPLVEVHRTAKLNLSLSERADPKVQLEQAIIEAQDQHRRLTEQAANVIANQKQAEMRLNRSMEELEKVNRSARQAVLMADEATKAGDGPKAIEYTQAAESFANRLITVEKEVESLKSLVVQSTQAADQAKAAVAAELGRPAAQASERQKLLSQLDQAKMQEQVNKAMASLSETVGQDVPTLEEVRDKIEGRYAKALGPRSWRASRSRTACSRSSRPTMHNEAQARLSEIRSQLGLGRRLPSPPRRQSRAPKTRAPRGIDLTHPALRAQTVVYHRLVLEERREVDYWSGRWRRHAGPTARLLVAPDASAGRGRRARSSRP